MSFSLTECYETIHAHPELSYQEYNTSKYVFDLLTSFGYEPKHYDKTGVIADLISDPSYPTLILRADMDALPVIERTGVPYASQNPGVMHACGHDSHTTMLLGAAQALYGRKLPQNIRFLFQPAEEVTGGALGMIRAGAVPEDAFAAFAMHVWPNVPYGTLATHAPEMMACADEFRVTIHGKSAHVAMRDQGQDALMTAVEIATKIKEIEALRHDPRTVFFLGTLASGESQNIVAEKAFLNGTIRTFSDEDHETIRNTFIETIQQICEKYGTTSEIEFLLCNAVRNNPKMIERLKGLSEAEKLPVLDDNPTPSMAGEDFSEYQRIVPGVLLWLGVGKSPALHSDNFIVPEALLPIGVKTLITIAETDWKDFAPSR